MTESRLNKKGLYSFLAITFGLTILVAVIMKLSGMSVVEGDIFSAQLILAGVMFVPALSSVIVRQFITREGWKDSGLKWGKFKDYFHIWYLVPLIFAMIYLITYLLGNRPDWSLTVFTAAEGLALPAPAGYMIVSIFVSTLLLTPFINSVAGFGEELGWRGYLLPKLMPLGSQKALWIHGLIWGLWHTPFVLLLGFGNYANIWLGAVMFLAVITFLGVYFGYLRLKSGSTLLASWAHGVFNSQSYGVWPIIFPLVNRYVGGVTGLVGIVVFGLLAWYALRKVKTLTPQI